VYSHTNILISDAIFVFFKMHGNCEKKKLRRKNEVLVVILSNRPGYYCCCFVYDARAAEQV
jgi:hypothetical protein